MAPKEEESGSAPLPASTSWYSAELETTALLTLPQTHRFSGLYILGRPGGGSSPFILFWEVEV